MLSALKFNVIASVIASWSLSVFYRPEILLPVSVATVKEFINVGMCGINTKCFSDTMIVTSVISEIINLVESLVGQLPKGML